MTESERNEKLENAGMRPLPSMLLEVEKFFAAVNESRVSIVTSIQMGPPITVTNSIVIKE